MGIPENNVSAPVAGMSIERLKASFLMQLQDLERKKREFIEVEITSLTQEQIDQHFGDLCVMFSNIELTARTVEELEYPTLTAGQILGEED